MAEGARLVAAMVAWKTWEDRPRRAVRCLQERNMREVRFFTVGAYVHFLSGENRRRGAASAVVGLSLGRKRTPCARGILKGT